MRLSTIAFRNLARNKKRTALSISTIVLACILGLFMLALISGMKADMEKNILAYYTGAVRIRNRDYDTYDYLNPIHLYVKDEVSLRERLMMIDGVTKTSGRISSGGKIYIDPDPLDSEPGDEYGAMVLGLDFDVEESILSPSSILTMGRLPRKGEREAILGLKLAEKTGLKIGDHFAFLTQTAQRSTNAMTFELTGLLNFPMGGMNGSHLLIPLSTAQDLMMMEGGALEIIVMTENPEKAEVQQEAIDQLLGSSPEFKDLHSSLWKEQGDFYGMMGIAEITYQFMVIFFLAMGATVIINTTMMVILERYREIGILRAMGMDPRELVRLFFLEALFAGIISAIIGISIGTALVLLMQKTGLNFSAAFESMDMEVSNILYPKLRWYQIPLMTIYTVGISALVTLLPCRKAAMIEPAEAIRSA